MELKYHLPTRRSGVITSPLRNGDEKGLYRMEFNGRLITEDADGKQNAVLTKWTVPKIVEAIQNGATGMISLYWYTIDGHKYKATGLTVGADYGVPREVNGKIIVTSQFRRGLLRGHHFSASKPMELVTVNVMIEPTDIEYVSMLVKTQPTIYGSYLQMPSDHDINLVTNFINIQIQTHGKDLVFSIGYDEESGYEGWIAASDGIDEDKASLLVAEMATQL